jgi:uncharacterized surface protein with fasciclin (FAS1) repeats
MANLIETAASREQFTTFVAALRKTTLADIVGSEGPFTVFAPTDDAFAHLPEGTINRLLQDGAKLRTILAYHIVAGHFTTADAERMSNALTTLEGSDLRIATTPAISVNGAHVVQADILADNGVLHAIDQVLLPVDDMDNLLMEHTDLTVIAPDAIVIVTAEETEEAKH